MESKEKMFSCMEHIDLVMEEFINEYEKSPDLIENNNGKCSYCNQTSKYEVK